MLLLTEGSPALWVGMVCLLMSTVYGINDDCFVSPCKRYGKATTCFQVGCKRAGLTSECHLSIISNTLPVGDEPVCIAVNEVPGFLEFCQEMVFNASTAAAPPGPVDIHKSTTSIYSTPTSTIISTENSKLVKDDVCYGTTIIVSVAVGCYLVGTFFTWVIFCCCKVTSCCSRDKKSCDIHSVQNCTSQQQPVTMFQERELGSTSSAQLLPNMSVETLSTQFTNDGRSNGSLSNGVEPVLSSRESRVAQWANENRAPHPVIQWTENGRTIYPHGRPNHTQWAEGVYAPVSESSSRDYQSILGGSENHYIPASESSSDYSGIQTHKVSIIRDGEIYQASSESSGNDYTSLKGQRFGSNRATEPVYYPASDSSYKDYATLNTEAADENANVRGDVKQTAGSGIGTLDGTGKVKPGADRTAKFNVSGLDLPTSSGSRSWRSKELEDINEYETVEDDRADVDARSGGLVTVNNGHVETLADMCAVNRETVDTATPVHHEYFQLDPM